MAEEAKTIRRTAETRFTRERNELLVSISSKSNRELVESNYAQLVDAWNILESKHDLYTMYLRDDELEDADKWITESQDLFSEATTAKNRMRARKQSTQKSSTKSASERNNCSIKQ